MSSRRTEHSVLTAHALAVGYRRAGTAARAVLHSVDFSVAGGTMICVVGPNGVGKSTLLRTLAGLQLPLAGRITLLDRPLEQWQARERARRIASVLTGFVETGYMTVRAMVALGRFPYAAGWGRLRSNDCAAIEEALRSVGIVHLGDRLVSCLSDGERQKALIARALAQKPVMLVLDEPTAYLDVTGRAEIMHTLRGLSRESGNAVVVSSHDIDLAMRTADLFWLIGCDGRLRTGAPEDLVLSGELASVFDAEGVSLDEQSGSFTFNIDGVGRAAVCGRDPARRWTARALQRLGYAVVDDDREVDVRVELDDVRCAAGTLTAGLTQRPFGSVAELCTVLRRARK